jgi:hypothetical protein
MIWELQWKVELTHAGIFSVWMVAKIMQLYLQKEIMEIDNISLKKTFSDLILFACMR